MSGLSVTRSSISCMLLSLFCRFRGCALHTLFYPVTPYSTLLLTSGWCLSLSPFSCLFVRLPSRPPSVRESLSVFTSSASILSPLFPKPTHAEINKSHVSRKLDIQPRDLRLVWPPTYHDDLVGMFVRGKSMIINFPPHTRHHCT